MSLLKLNETTEHWPIVLIMKLRHMKQASEEQNGVHEKKNEVFNAVTPFLKTR